MLIISILLALVALALYLKYVYSYWKRKGFPYLEPTIPFGNLDSFRKREHSFGTAICHLYNNTTEPVVGIYLFFRPALLIRDADLAKDILTKNFAQFHDRGIYCNEEKDPLSANLFALPGIKWKTLRTKLTPAFTSGKLKSMFSTIEAVGKQMQAHIDARVGDGKEFEMKNLLTRYAVDVIESVIFGLDANSIDDPSNEFFQITREINKSNFLSRMRGLAVFLCPGLIEKLGIRALPTKVADFMVKIVKQTIEFREKSNQSRKDLMQLLLQLRNTGKVDLDGVWEVETVAENLKSMSIEQIAAQVFLFHIAGTETSANTAAYCLFEVARNKDILHKLEQNIAATLKKHNNILTYDALQDMEYLEFCILETIRKYPGLPILNRECTETFQIPGSEYIIEKNTAIIIPTLGIQRDEKYFPDPMKFDPERFANGKKNFHEPAFLPFGDGPRACIALRLGKINAKMAVVMLLMKYNFEVSIDKEIEFNVDNVGLVPKDGLYMRVTKRGEKKLEQL